MRTKKLKLLVDNIRHISDHGLAVQFADPQLKALVDSLKKDGITKLEAGQSSLRIQTVGRVTFTKLFLAHGSYTIRNVHYLDEEAGLKFRHQESEDEHAHDTLAGIILGKDLPANWRCQFGDSQDTLRGWLKKYAWTLAGEAGMRAKAVEQGERDLKDNVGTCKGAVEYAKRQVNIFGQRDFDKEIEAARKKALGDCRRLHENDKLQKSQLIAAEADDYSGNLAKRRLGMYEASVRKTNGEFGYDYKYQFPGTKPTTSHEIAYINYTATREGDNIRLSSGIVCEVTASRALAWLKGEQDAPRTTYGTCSLREMSTDDGQPIKVVKYGCHVLDLRNLGEDFAQALTPTHTVTVVPGTPTIYWDTDREACLERMKKTAESYMVQNNSARNDAVRTFCETKKKLLETKNNKEAVLEKLEADVVAQEEALEKAEQTLADYKQKIMTGGIDTMQTNIIKACNALLGLRA